MPGILRRWPAGTIVPGVCVIMAVLALVQYGRYQLATREASRIFDPAWLELNQRFSRRLAIEPDDFEIVWASAHLFVAGQSAEVPRNLMMAEGKGTYITPLYIPHGSTEVYDFEVRLNSPGTAVDAWLASAEPCHALASFQQFNVCVTGSNTLRLVAQAAPGASLEQMRFSVVLLKQTAHQ